MLTFLFLFTFFPIELSHLRRFYLTSCFCLYLYSLICYCLHPFVQSTTYIYLNIYMLKFPPPLFSLCPPSSLIHQILQRCYPPGSSSTFTSYKGLGYFQKTHVTFRTRIEREEQSKCRVAEFDSFFPVSSDRKIPAHLFPHLVILIFTTSQEINMLF